MDHNEPLFENAKLKGRIIEKYGSRKACAQAIGWTEPTLAAKINGQKELKKADVFALSYALDIEPEQQQEFFYTLKV